MCARLHFSLRQADIARGLLEPVAELLDAETASFRSLVRDEDSAKPEFVVALGIPDSVNASYLSHYHKLDPARRLLFRRLKEPLFASASRVGEWSRESAPAGTLEQYRAEFRQYRREFLLPNGFYHHVGFCIPDLDGRALLFDFHRKAVSREFGALERARARIVALFLHAKAQPNRQADGAHVPAEASHLSARELEVAEAVAVGLSNKQVASGLGISVRTVENHLRSIFAKLGVTTRTRLAAKVRETDGRALDRRHGLTG
jgi:DNA-binding CsgD family transcriptional regulator